MESPGHARPFAGACYALDMISVRARVRNGRLVLDEPTDLPEGTVVELVSGGDLGLAEVPTADERLTPDEVRELRELADGQFVPHAELRRRLAGSGGHTRPA